MPALTLDFETKPIGARPDDYPPEPVGVALKVGARRGKYYGWGHPTANNCTYHDGMRAIHAALEACDTLICHNLPFDVSVLNERMDTSLKGHRLIDTQVLAFLADPYSSTLSLKPLAERYLNEPPTEQDALRKWLIDAGIVSKALKREWAAQIWQAPGDLVGIYAVGDVERTHALYKYWAALTKTEGFAREMALQPVLIAMERRGVPINGRELVRDLADYETRLEDNARHIRKLLRTGPLDMEKGDQIAAALTARYPGIELPKTPTGKISTARAALDGALPDGALKAALMYDSSLRFTLKTFLRPWVAQHKRTPNRLHPSWNGTRNDRGGARTGRLSSTPNLQNLNDREKELILLADLARMAPHAQWVLPALRNYVQAPTGMLLYGRDYSQVELRATAFFENGDIAQGYRDDPDWDLHAWVTARVAELFQRTITRRQAKSVGFGIIYGAGKRAIADQTGLSENDAGMLKNMYLSVLPSLRGLMRDVQNVGRMGSFITTLGMRTYKTQPGVIAYDDSGEYDYQNSRTYEYKLLNYLVQGSCADLQKEAMIECERRGIPLVMSIHDEPVALMQRGSAKQRREILSEMGEAMLHNTVADRFDVPLLSSAYYAKKWAEKTEVVC